MDELQQIEIALATLEAQRALLGDAVVATAAAPLRARLDALRAAQAASEQQLRPVSVLFVDTVGSTAMGARLDPEDIQAVMDGALARFTASVQAERGRVLQYTGDGLLAAFGGEQVREDDAERAVRAALAILETARVIAGEVQQRHGVEGYGVRTGIASGQVLLGGGVDAEGTIRGSTVNLASRMEQHAPPGGLRIDHATWRLVRGVFRVSEEPPLAVKGSAEPLRTYLVLGLKPRGFRAPRRGLDDLGAPLVAREDELQTLQDAWQALNAPAGAPGSAGTTGAPGMATVALMGEAGMGKSRLLHEFELWLDAQEARAATTPHRRSGDAHGEAAASLAASPPPEALRLRARAEPHTQTRPFALLHDVVAWHCGIEDDDPPERARERLEQAIAPLLPGDEGPAAAHRLGQLVGLDFAASPHVRGVLHDARQLRNHAFHAAAQWLRLATAASGRPLLLLLDDLQWADDGSLDFVQYLVQVARDVPALLLLATRPSLFERRADFKLLAEAATARVVLEPLDRRASRELAGALLHRLPGVPALLRDLLVGGAEGNPFYMEELVRMLLDDGAIVERGEGWELLPERLQHVQVPPTLAGVLQARLDALPAPQRPALQRAAVVGHVLWEPALRALDAAADTALPGLLERGLLLPREPSSLPGSRELTFQHQLLQQVAYDSLLKSQRREGHSRVAAWLQTVQQERGVALHGLRAWHLERAGDDAAAALASTEAAEDAAARYAHREVLAFAERALALADPGAHALRWRVHAVCEPVRRDAADTAAQQAVLDAMQALAETLDAACGDRRHAIEVAQRRSAAARSAGDYVRATAEAERAREWAAGCADPTAAIKASHALATSLAGLGRYDEARAVAEDGVALAVAAGDDFRRGKLLNSLGLVAMEQGDLSTAVGHFTGSLALARAAGDPAEEGVLLSNLGSCCARLGDYASARAHLDAALALARRTGRRATEALVLLNIASAAHLQADETAALAYARAAQDAAAASGQRDLQAYGHLVAGHAELALGRLDAAEDAYAQALQRLQALQLRAQQLLDPISGLARVALAQGRLETALAHAEPLLAHWDAGGRFEGTEEPLLPALSAWRVLDACGDTRAPGVLAAAVAELQAQAARLGDDAARDGFLTRVPHHRELMAAWRARLRA